VEVNNHIMLIGGVSEECSDSKGYEIIPTLTVTKKDLCWGSPTRKWNFRKATGDIPSKRYGHTATRAGNKIFVFGGRDPHSTTSFSDFYYLDLDIMVWKRIELPGEPSPRYNHTCTYVKKRLFVIGGVDSGQNGALFGNNIGVFNLENWAWEEGSLTSMGIAGHIAIPYTSTTNPYILVFGGSSHLVDFSTPDYTSSIQPLKKFIMFEIESRKWEYIDTKLPTEIGPVTFHAATWRHQKKGGMQIFINGGFKDRSDDVNHTLILTIEQHRIFNWTTPTERYFSFVETPVLRHHNMVIIEDELYLLGGIKDLGKQPSPYLCGCIPCIDILNYTTIYKIELPEE